MSQKAVTLNLFFGARGAGVRVLLVGASPTAATNCACLSAAGYGVQLEQAGKAALAALNQAPFDLLDIDWKLPDRDGCARRAMSVVSNVHDGHDI
jgi:DNA-binding response OmpR family regulator